jgi:hypothetical protein
MIAAPPRCGAAFIGGASAGFGAVGGAPSLQPGGDRASGKLLADAPDLRRGDAGASLGPEARFRVVVM